MFELITSYRLAVEEIRREISLCKDGDRIGFCIYLWEPGKSSELILNDLEAAAERGVRINIDIDYSRVSRFARFVEHTETLMDDIRRLEKRHPSNVSCLSYSFPIHSKFYLFDRGGENLTLIFGSMNLGDRFSDWKDFSVKVKSAALGKYVYERFVLGKDSLADNLPLRIIANDPKRKIFEVEEGLRSIFNDRRFDEYTIITPYIDRRGTKLLDNPLKRGAKVNLIIPMQANIYQNANIRNISQLATLPNVKVLMYQKMIHVKAVLAKGETKACFVGSANMKKNSFDILMEFNGIIEDADLNQQISEEVDKITEFCVPFCATPYKKIMSRVEEFLG